MPCYEIIFKLIIATWYADVAFVSVGLLAPFLSTADVLFFKHGLLW